ncbi:MAG TPA: helix-turn-helix domain-containing protein [Terrimicrobiaceae bacterium]
MKTISPVFSTKPPSALSQFVKRIFVVESPHVRRHTVLPDTGFVLAFRFQGDCTLDGFVRLPRAVITGMRDTARSFTHDKGSAVILAALTETGAAAFLREPASDFFNSTIALDAVWGTAAALNLTVEQLAEARNHAHRIRILESYLYSCIREMEPDPNVSAAVQAIKDAGADVRIGKLARHVGLSQSALERRFRRTVGTSPRTFASIVRFRNALRLRTSGMDLTTVAYSAGYYDQSHFINDFKRVTGLAPQRFFQEQPAFC